MKVFCAFGVVILSCFVLYPASAQDRFPAADAHVVAEQLGVAKKSLPAWALTLAKPLPKTTAAMLRLDYLHRAKNPLGPVLAGKLHLAAAEAMDCEYARRYALADLRRAGRGDVDIKKLIRGDDRAVIEFALKMTEAAYTVTDDEVAELIKEYGAECVVAMVHTLAWANFRNRVLLAIGTKVEPGGPLLPVDCLLDKSQKEKLKTPARPPWNDVVAAKVPGVYLTKIDWPKRTDAELVEAMERQKERKSRIALPGLAKLDKLPSEVKARMAKIAWSRVSLGYQPMLTQMWGDTMGMFQREARLNPVFSSSQFWIVTRSNECFY
ncbi:MAG: hypothetical protein FJ303_20415 [Planctomycetes bacterium]|nr:hypothetical protein [Planctomycetota bacterium]